MTNTSAIVDSVTAGSTSLLSGVMIVPPNDLTPMHTILIPLITGILAPLVKELILSLRENRKRKREEKNERENQNNN